MFAQGLEIAGLGVGLICFVWLIGLAGTVFWIWMIIDAAMNEPSEGIDKVVWIIIILVLPFIGSLVYYFVRRPERIRTHGK